MLFTVTWGNAIPIGRSISTSRGHAATRMNAPRGSPNWQDPDGYGSSSGRTVCRVGRSPAWPQMPTARTAPEQTAVRPCGSPQGAHSVWRQSSCQAFRLAGLVPAARLGQATADQVTDRQQGHQEPALVGAEPLTVGVDVDRPRGDQDTKD